jgi:4-hydroxy-3-methylbut-2-enyl diphosphate reductase
LCEPRLPTYHIADADCLLSDAELRHKPVMAKGERVATDWLPPSGPVAIGLTSGASTPDNLVGTVVRRLDNLVNLSR